MAPLFFATPAAFRRWLKAHHSRERELLVGFYKKGSGRSSITWSESVDEALCVGWIDGVRRRIDDESHSIRFSQRRSASIWSSINIQKMAKLIREGRVLPAGLKAFKLRSEKKSGIYSYEQRKAARLDKASEKEFRSHKPAWEFFGKQAPSYRRMATWWVVSARKDETRRKRLARLIAVSAKLRRI
jgi:uncharacterized protein YdeI (YjbR/CyaY-like superfamily)